MANPKGRHSRARRDKSWSHFHLILPTLSRCPKCKELKRPHRVCPSCGTYKGVVILKSKEGSSS